MFHKLLLGKTYDLSSYVQHYSGVDFWVEFWEEQAVQKQSSEELCHQQNEAT
jgi:hypothetical protein